MNKVMITGNIARISEKEKVLYLTVASDSRHKEEADFITAKAFGSTKDFISKYFEKGKSILYEAHISTSRRINKNTGEAEYYTDIIIDNVEFNGKK